MNSPNVASVQLGPKQPRPAHRLAPPLVFVLIMPDGEYHCFYCHTQDMPKRRRILDTIAQLAASDPAEGPSKVSWLFELLLGRMNVDELDASGYADELEEAFLRVTPVEGEWVSVPSAMVIEVQPRSVVTTIYMPDDPMDED